MKFIRTRVFFFLVAEGWILDCSDYGVLFSLVFGFSSSFCFGCEGRFVGIIWGFRKFGFGGWGLLGRLVGI